MTSVAPITPEWSFATNRLSAADRVNSSALDGEFSSVTDKINELLLALATSIRADNTLVDELVRLRNLHPEVFTEFDNRMNGLLTQALENLTLPFVPLSMVSETAGAGSIPKAGLGGKLDAGWLPTIPVLARWGELSGNIADQTDLQAALALKADLTLLVVDGAAAVPSLRTLGTAGTQACAGNDSRLSNARTPTTHGSTHRRGGADDNIAYTRHSNGSGTLTLSGDEDTVIVEGTHTAVQIATTGLSGLFTQLFTILNQTAGDISILPPANTAYNTYTIEGGASLSLPRGCSVTLATRYEQTGFEPDTFAFNFLVV